MSGQEYLAPSWQFDKLPPQNLDAERCLIASMMLAAGAVDEVIRVVDRDDLFQVDHQILFDVITRLRGEGKPIDAVIVRGELEKRQMLSEVGGTEYLAQVLGSVPSYHHARQYAAAVKEASMLRRLIAASNDNLRDAYAPHQNSGDVLERAQGRMINLTKRSSSLQDAVPIIDVLYEVYDQAVGGGTPMLQLPFNYLNERMGGGVAFGEFVIVAGWPSHGKSALTKQFGEYLAANGHPGGIITLEESRHKIGRNMIASQSRVNNHTIRKGHLSQNDDNAVTEAIGRLGTMGIYVQDHAETLAQVVAAMNIGVADQAWQWAVVDHVDLIDLGDIDEENERTKHNTMSRTLKNAAKRLNIPVFAVKQLKKRGTSIRKPSPDDLRESGAYHADADVILFVDSDDVHNRENADWQHTGITDLIVSKAREGVGGIHKVRWDGATQRFQPL